MKKRIWAGSLLAAAMGILAACAAGGGSTEPISVVKTEGGEVSFKDTVHPILLDHCTRCHGESADGELSVLTYEGVMKGGKTPGFIKPGDPEGSKLITSVEKTVVPYMPPKIFPALTEDRIAVIKQWIEEGAKNN